MKGVVYKIKEGKLGIWKDWCHEVSTTLRKEAIATLGEEKSTQEVFLIFKLDGQWYTLGAGEGECLSSNKEKEINIKHDQMKKECLSRGVRTETLYHIKVIEGNQYYVQ
jgi:hypothetical protein